MKLYFKSIVYRENRYYEYNYICFIGNLLHKLILKTENNNNKNMHDMKKEIKTININMTFTGTKNVFDALFLKIK